MKVVPAPGRVQIVVLDRDDRFLRWVPPEYANAALDRDEVERTQWAGVVRVAKRDDVDWVPLDGNGKPMRPVEPAGKRSKRQKASSA